MAVRAGVLLSRRPLFLACVIGATVSLSVTGSLSLRLALSTALAWSFVPIVEVAALTLVTRRGRGGLPLAVVIDRFSESFALVELWLLGIAIITAAVPLAWFQQTFFGWLEVGGAALLAISLYIDFRFFRNVLGRDRFAAVRDLLLHRALTWIPILLISGGPGVMPTLRELIGR